MAHGALASTLTVAARGWSQVAAVVLLLAAGRYLDIDAFGEFAVASALAMMLTQWVGVGCYERVLSCHAAGPAHDTGLLINSLSALAMAAIGMLVGVAAFYIYGSWTIAAMVWLLAPLALPAGWRSAGEAAMIGEGRLVRFAVSTIAIETLALGLGVAALLADQGVYALVAAKYVQLALGGPVLLICAGRWPRLRFDREEAQKIYTLWRSLIVDRVLSYFQNYSADLLLGALLSPAAAGVYRISLRVVSLVNAVIADPLRSLGWTMLARAKAQGQSTSHGVEAMIGLAYVLLSGPLALLALTGGGLAVLALGTQWAQAGPVIALLAGAAMVMLPSLLSEAAFGVAGATHQLPRQRAIFVVVALLLMVVAAPFGPAWTAASQLAASLISLGVVLRGQSTYLDVRPAGYAPLAGRALIAAAAAVAAATLAGHLPSVVDSPLRAVSEVVVGMTVYVVLVLGSPAMRDSLLGFARAVAGPAPSPSPAGLTAAVAA